MSSRLECTSSRDTTNADEDGDELRYHVFLFVFVGRFLFTKKGPDWLNTQGQINDAASISSNRFPSILSTSKMPMKTSRRLDLKKEVVKISHH